MGQTDEIIIKIEGMTCGHCKMAVEKALKEVAGVKSVRVDLDKNQAMVTGSPIADDLYKAIEEAGYAVVL